ncbi:tyrosine-type recombinase/integrase [Bradyrhizobium sp. DOA1]|uniref:tyrosine-type recombinase/integrase n=1 Tax=Bradyrhizobium sp. DOA1 TaxID=1126616 RepID=UPI00077CB63C|nr:tyrosine-type recombinase/integrase [Bradyrhizobium sp. DOA1]
MTQIKLRRLTVDTSENITRYYVRLPGQPKVRIYGEPGSEEFMEAYRRAIGGDKAVVSRPVPTNFAPHSLGRAILGYYTCSKYEALGESRKRSRRLILNKIAETAGQELVRDITKGTIQKGMDRRAKTPAAANEFLKSMRAVLDYLVSVDELEANPAKLVKYNAIKTDGFHIWTIDEVARFVEHHGLGSKAVLALALLLFTGQRRGDVIKMGPQHVKDGSMRLRRGKNGESGSIPVLPPLQAVIDASEIGHLTYLVTAFGKPFSDAGIGNWFRDRCDEAGLPHCSAHGLRKAGATIAADLGASDEQLMALFGWRSRRQVSTYTRGANQKKLAHEAGSRIAAALKMNGIVPLSGTVESQRDKTTKKGKEIKR